MLKLKNHSIYLLYLYLDILFVVLVLLELSERELERKFGNSEELKGSGARILSASSSFKGAVSSSMEAAHHVAGCDYERGTCWGTEVLWLCF